MKRVMLDWQDIPDLIEFSEDTHLIGIFEGRDQDVVKRQLVVTHTKPHLTTRIDFRAVLYDKSNFDVETVVKIPDGANDTDTYLSMKALLISEQAKARVIPSLEIQEDEVKGGHGATIGSLNAEQMYYLMSRGLNREGSMQVLIKAFLEELA